MKLTANLDRLSVNFSKGTVTDIRVHVERFDNASYLRIYNDKWSIDNDKLTAYAPTENGGKFVLEFSKNEFGLGVIAHFTAGENQTIEQALRIRIEGRIDKRIDSALHNDFDGWYNGNRCLFHMNCYADTTKLVEDQMVHGVEYVGFRTKNNSYGVVGVCTYDNYFSTIDVYENGKFFMITNLNEHWYVFDSVKITPNQHIVTDKFMVIYADTDALPVYGKAIAKENGAERKFEVATGYNTGYYFGPDITEENMLKELEAIKNAKLPIKYFNMDWGWYVDYGDWDANEKFPHGMKYMADKIYEAGYVPGIWIAPLMVSKTSSIYRDHKDWLIMDSDYTGGNRFYLDFSVEGAAKWLYDLFRKICVEWGYKYIKVDFIVDRLGMGGYKDKSFNAMKNFREFIRIIREAITEDTYFITCTAPISPSVKYATGTRLTHDIHNDWTTLKRNARQGLKRLHVNEYLIGDPDVLMVRKPEQHDQDCKLVEIIRNDTEINTDITFQSVSGGAIFTGDKIGLLDDKTLDRFRALLPANQKYAKPLDIYDREMPSIFYYGYRGEYEMYALINWQDFDYEHEITLDEEKFCQEYFSKERFEKAKTFKFSLKPHESKILYFVKDEKLLDKLGLSIMPV